MTGFYRIAVIRTNVVEGEDPLEVHQLLASERAVVVEHGDAGRRRDVLGTGRVGDRLYELHEALLSQHQEDPRKLTASGQTFG